MMNVFRTHIIILLVLWNSFIVFVQSLKVPFYRSMTPSLKNQQLLSIVAIEQSLLSIPTFQYVSNNIYKHQRKTRIKAATTTTISLSLMTASSPIPNTNVKLSTNDDSNNNNNNNNNNFDRNSLRLYLELVPLIGGPKFLPIHVKVVLEKTYSSRTDSSKNDLAVVDLDPVKYKFDFIPQNATEQSTINKLLQLQFIPGLIRCQDENKNSILRDQTKLKQQQIDESTIVQKAFAFCDNYTNNNLHLILNNCWTFAVPLYLYLYSYISLQQQQRNLR